MQLVKQESKDDGDKLKTRGLSKYESSYLVCWAENSYMLDDYPELAEMQRQQETD